MQFIWPKDIFPIRIGPQSGAWLAQQTIQIVASLRSQDLTLFVRELSAMKYQFFYGLKHSLSDKGL
jgi:hypothetical protein